MNRILLLIYLLVALGTAGVFSSVTLPGEQPPLAPEPHHTKVVREIVNIFRFYHYEEQEFDDTLSALVYNKYLDMLDGNRMYFMASDIQDFAPYKYKLDDDLKASDLTFPYLVYNRLTERMNERIDFALSTKESDFDYTGSDTYKYDREKDPWLKSRKSLDSLWNLKLKSESLSLRLAGKKEEQSEETLRKRYTNLRDQLKKQRSEDVFQLYMNALAESIEPHTSYFSPRTAESFKISMSNSLEGIGATLRTDGEYTKVVSVTKGSPADKSKEISANDKIISIAQGDDGEMEDVIGWRIDDVVSKIRGAKGTVVRLEIIPSGAGPNTPTKIVRLVRDKIKLEEQSAKSEIINLKYKERNYQIGVVHLPSFYLDFEAMQRKEKDYKSTTGDVTKILTEFKSKNVDAVIMDLRGNGGGSLYEAVELTGLFIDQGPVVQVRDSHGGVEVKTDEPGTAYSGPLAVMVDRFSASASEIFAAAIQDYGRGIIVGSQTYGKGTVQNLIDLSRVMPTETAKLGQLKITMAKFYRISGGSTQHAGVTPDIEIPGMFSAEEFGESSEPTALPYDKIASTSYKVLGNLQPIIPTLRKEHEARMSVSSDYAYLLDNIKEYNRRKEEKFITLNEMKLKSERDEADKKELERYNKRRISKGLAPIQKLDDKPVDDKDDDFLLDETGAILIDMIRLLNSSAAKSR